jgi:hypothetical protein
LYSAAEKKPAKRVTRSNTPPRGDTLECRP